MSMRIKDVRNRKIDLLLITPSSDYKKRRRELMGRRIEEDIVVQNSPAPGIGYLIAVAKQNNAKVKYIDMIAEYTSIEQLLRYIREQKPALVGFTSMTVQINDAGAIAKEIKKQFPEVSICIGGIHPTVMPKETLEEFDGFDFVVCGEGEYVMTKVLDALKNGSNIEEIKGVITREKEDCSFDLIEDLDALPFPAWEELNLDRYTGVFPHRRKLELPMCTSRGCPNSCIFCVQQYGRRRRQRSVASVISEIERNISDFGCDAIAFIDDTFLIDVKWGYELFNTMIERGINKKITWACEFRVDAASPELLRLMKKAGCYYIFFGIESANENILKTVKKNLNIDQVKNTVKWCQDVGIVPCGSIIIGLPGETEETVTESIKFAQGLNLYSITFPMAVPFPGTVLRDLALKREYGLKILTNNWSDYGKQYPGVMDSDHLSMGRLKELQDFAYKCLPKKKINVYIAKMEKGQIVRGSQTHVH